jgi:hypothetical protein
MIIVHVIPKVVHWLHAILGASISFTDILVFLSVHWLCHCIILNYLYILCTCRNIILIQLIKLKFLLLFNTAHVYFFYWFTFAWRIFHLCGDVPIAGEGLQNFVYPWHLGPLSREGICGLGFSVLIRRTAPFSRLLRHTRGCWGPMLTSWIQHTGILLYVKEYNVRNKWHTWTYGENV